MSLAFWLVITPLSLWLAVCAVIWIWYYFWGQHQDHSGDMGLAVLFIPIMPFMLVYHKIMEMFK